MHTCLKCKNKSDNIPDSVIVTREIWKRIDETTLKLTKVEVNVANELKTQMKEMKAIYKHVHYCPKLKAVVVGSDSPAQQRKKCEHFAK